MAQAKGSKDHECRYKIPMDCEKLGKSKTCNLNFQVTFNPGKIFIPIWDSQFVNNRLIWFYFRSIKLYDGFFNFEGNLLLQTIDERSTFVLNLKRVKCKIVNDFLSGTIQNERSIFNYVLVPVSKSDLIGTLLSRDF